LAEDTVRGIEENFAGGQHSPEIELLLRCARPCTGSEGSPQLKALLQEKLDWTYLIRMAQRHGVRPLLFWHLNTTSPEAVPRAVMEQLRDYYLSNGLRNMRLTGELLRLLDVFEAQGIPAVPYKGPVLAAFAYGNLGLREFVDIDVLVRKQEVSRAQELLLAEGYQPQYWLTPAQDAAFLRYNCEHAFVHSNGGSAVDLHWAIAERHFSFSLDHEGLWRRLDRISLGGRDVCTLSPEDLLLILCVQGFKDSWERLKHVCDVAEVIRVHQDMDWGRVIKQADASGGRRTLFLGLALASDLLGTTLPKEIAQRVQTDPAVRTLARRVQERLFRTSGSPKRFSEVMFRSIHVQMRERLRDKVRYCVRSATTHTVGDWMALPLPRPLFSLYYVLRPIRLVGKYGGRLFKWTP
jgi:hypothetical protein